MHLACQGREWPIDGATWYPDGDGDGFGSTEGLVQACVQPDHYVAADGDCDDTDPATNPDAAEVCDTRDNDCDGSTDEDAVDASTWHMDADGDGFGDPDLAVEACEQPLGMTDDATDCDDAEPDANPGATEVCDGIDNDCNGVVDGEEATDPTWWYADADSDGYGDGYTKVQACDQPSGYVSNFRDCDDTDPDVHRDAKEICDGIDNDCDSKIDDDDSSLDTSTASTWYSDADGDGYGDASTPVLACLQPSGTTDDTSDCDDTDATVWPGATEVCDGVDNDCDGAADDDDDDVDPGSLVTWYADGDGDGYGDPASSADACSAPSGYVASAQDCDDMDDAVNPDSDDPCGDGIDQDCSGADEMCEQLSLAEAGAILTGEGARDGAGGGDLALGAHGNDDAGTDAGAVYVFMGPLTLGSASVLSADVTILGLTAGGEAGDSLDAAGDLDGDGLDDLLIGAWNEGTVASDAGAAYVVLGAVTAGVSLSVAEVTVFGEGANDHVRVHGAGDVDADGLADFVIGSRYNDRGASNGGAAFLFYGGDLFAP